MSSVLGIPEVFQSTELVTYALDYDGSGVWMDADGRACNLLSIDRWGETRWAVRPESASFSDREAVAHFNLTPWWAGGELDRRSQDRRVAERRQAQRRATDRA